MKVIKLIIKNLFASIGLSIALMIIYAAAIGIATFIEKYYGTVVANDVIYKAWWFDVLNIWLGLNIIGCMILSIIYRKKFKWAIQILHFGFILAIIGAGITRFWGFEGTMSIQNGETSHYATSADHYLNLTMSNEVDASNFNVHNISADSIISKDSFQTSLGFNLSPYTRSSINDSLEVYGKKLTIKSIDVINISKEKKENLYVARLKVTYDGVSQNINVVNNDNKAFVMLGDRILILTWGPKKVALPFAIKLEKFHLDMYPGSTMHSAYSSDVLVIDKELKEPMKFKIYMNHVLDYRGYRFFQSSYTSKDVERSDGSFTTINTGTVLSVNKDPGKIPTYVSYAFMIVGAILLLFVRDGRFRKLSRFVKSQRALAVLVVVGATLGMPHLLKANEANSTSSVQKIDMHGKDSALGSLGISSTPIDTAKVSAEESKNAKAEAKEAPKEDSKIATSQAMEEAHKSIEESKGVLNDRYAVLEQAFAKDDPASIKARVDSLKTIKSKYLDEFKRLQMQDTDGRIKLVDTFATDLMRKIVGSDSYKGINSTEFLLGLMTLSSDMAKVRFIKVSDKHLREFLGVTKGKYVALSDAFDMKKIEQGDSSTDSYKLYNLFQDAMRKPQGKQNEFDKAVIKLNEQLGYVYPGNIWSYLKIFPNKNDNWLALDDLIVKKLNPGAFQLSIEDEAKLKEISPQTAIIINAIGIFFRAEIQMAMLEHDYSNMDKLFEILSNYQDQNGGPLFLDKGHVNAELILNKVDIFPAIEYAYLILGIILFIFSLVAIIRDKRVNKYLGGTIWVFMLITLIIHTIALILRWYISGHAPWTNGYESMLYIAWAAGIAGIIILRKSYLALCSATFLAGIALLVAHWGFMDPQIGNLVPVLKSYWLNIHVSIIVASYGFFGLSAVLGIIVLLLFIARGKTRPHIDNAITSLTAVNEMSLMLGLFLLVIGNFLGGVWANESWGRYWGWDSKETWALVSIGVYAVILHVRFLKIKYFPYVLNLLAIVGFYSVIMTYFGVNYYLAGMHSYASGESAPIPPASYVISIILLIIIIIAGFKAKLKMPKF
ncbi:cytochrome c biogenesis protein CcsA [Helicobacter sp. 11S02629-2]|uniref:cytochrome c biogenesis protein CcsA n=1 Tax=Helicobacter sp. 11S02629-2 TaxID=1476195 RepID=UPI000BA57B53|nr:cytochrome c biogenesis protein CcsA [Helicobacter sp. 11S02629-2]PAF43279.1 hypothetical protein BKH40_07190 [Helicobacter sp. 11S02629-2]